MTNWIHNRTSFLDTKFSEDCIADTTDIDFSETKYLVGPNPTFGLLNIQSEADTTFDVVIYNNMGQLILQLELTGKDNSISLAGLRGGLYTVSIIADDDAEVFKILVK